AVELPGGGVVDARAYRCPTRPATPPIGLGRLAGMGGPTFPYRDLPEFLRALEGAGELHRVRVPVDPDLEITEIVTRTVRAGGPALLFERPTRGTMPLAINLFGTRRRMAMALGVEDVDEVGARIGELVRPELPAGWAGIRE